MPELCTLVDDAVRIVGSHAAIAAPGRKRQAGIGLVELMISAVISLLLVAAVVGLTVSSSSSYHMQTNHARIQENARFAIQLLSRDIRLAGYLGCLTSSTLLTNNLDVAGDGNLYDMRWFLEGLEQGQSAWLPSGGSASALNALADTDAITIRFANPTRGGGLQAPAAPTGQIDVDNAAFNFGTGNIAVITDCDKGDVFQVSNEPGADNILEHVTGDIAPGNRSDSLGGIATAAYGTDASVYAVNAVRYYVRHRDPDDPQSAVALYRNYITQQGVVFRQELVEGVENIQFLYGEDGNADGAADSYASADGVSNWRNVVSVQLAVLVRTNEEFGLDEEQRQNVQGLESFDMLGHTFNIPEDSRFQRELFSATVNLRNSL